MLECFEFFEFFDLLLALTATLRCSGDSSHALRTEPGFQHSHKLHNQPLSAMFSRLSTGRRRSNTTGTLRSITNAPVARPPSASKPAAALIERPPVGLQIRTKVRAPAARSALPRAVRH